MASLALEVEKNDRAAPWRAVMTEAVREPAELCRLLELDPSLIDRQAAIDFPLLVPRTFISRIQPGEPKDPLLVQVMPSAAENASPPGFRADPLCEADAAVCPGLLRKYQGRSLILATDRCAVHCRYCFRRHFRSAGISQETGVFQEPANWDRILGEIAAERSIHEVILSGGDPLTLTDRQLAELAGRLAEIPHLRRLRLHTRLPVMIPQRVTDSLISWLRGTRLVGVVVLQINHAAEIDAAVAAALARLVDAGIPVLSQSVLLRGVNDSVAALSELFERLVDHRVVPYSLHQLDAVSGASNFLVDRAYGVALIEQLRAMLPGYAIPRYVRETPGGVSKQTLA
jgi:EF-P beta-lysylation protein EpmB